MIIGIYEVQKTVNIRRSFKKETALFVFQGKISNNKTGERIIMSIFRTKKLHLYVKSLFFIFNCNGYVYKNSFPISPKSRTIEIKRDFCNKFKSLSFLNINCFCRFCSCHCASLPIGQGYF